MDMKELMNMANSLRDQLLQAQDDAAKARIPGEAGGGLVKVVMNGQFEVVDLSIDPKLAGEDMSLLEDLVQAAVNKAVTGVNEQVKGRFGNMAEGMGMDMNDFDPSKMDLSKLDFSKMDMSELGLGDDFDPNDPFKQNK